MKLCEFSGWNETVCDLISPLLKWSLYLPLFSGGDSRHGTSGSETKNLVAHVCASTMGSSLLTSFVPTSTGVKLCVIWVPLGDKVDTEFFYQTISKPSHSSKLLLPQQSKLPYQPWETAWVEYVQSLEVLAIDLAIEVLLRETVAQELQRNDFRKTGVICWSRQGGAWQKGIVSLKVIFFF